MILTGFINDRYGCCFNRIGGLSWRCFFTLIARLCVGRHKYLCSKLVLSALFLTIFDKK